jgi:ankyrin repeat protein
MREYQDIVTLIQTGQVETGYYGLPERYQCLDGLLKRIEELSGQGTNLYNLLIEFRLSEDGKLLERGQDGMTLLELALKYPQEGTEEFIKTLTHNGYPVKYYDVKPEPVLITAIKLLFDAYKANEQEKGQHLLRAVLALIEGEPDLTRANLQGETALHLAINNAHLDLVNALLAFDEGRQIRQISIADRSGKVPLWIAIKRYIDEVTPDIKANRLEIVKSLIATAPDEYLTTALYKETPLLFAIRRIDPQLIQALLGRVIN